MRAKAKDERAVSLFRNGQNQAVRIPQDFELPGTKAVMRREGDRLVIEATRKRGLAEYLRRPQTPIAREFPEIEDFPLNEEDVF